MARDAGARKVYFASAAPPVKYPNVYGIDIPSCTELVAFERSEEDVAVAIELWEDKSSRLARHGADYVLPAAYKKVALKKILTGKIKETFELWETEKLPFQELL